MEFNSFQMMGRAIMRRLPFQVFFQVIKVNRSFKVHRVFSCCNDCIPTLFIKRHLKLRNLTINNFFPNHSRATLIPRDALAKRSRANNNCLFKIFNIFQGIKKSNTTFSVQISCVIYTVLTLYKGRAHPFVENIKNLRIVLLVIFIAKKFSANRV